MSIIKKIGYGQISECNKDMKTLLFGNIQYFLKIRYFSQNLWIETSKYFLKYSGYRSVIKLVF